jgi:ribose transport system ATP-binding protein
MQSSTILELRHIDKSFPGVAALRDVSLSVSRGKAHALIGENGAGKSTLLKILAGNQPPDNGEVIIDGAAVRLDTPKAARLAGIAMIHQELQLVPHMSVAQNMFLGIAPVRHGFVTDRAGMEERSRAALAELHADIDVRRRIVDLSIAQRQLVEIARALLGNARIIAMDEPTSALTDKEFEALESLIGRIRARGVAVIYVSHKLEELARVCETATILRDGRVIAEIKMAERTQGEIIALMVGRSLEFRKAGRRTPGGVVLEARGLSWKGRVRDVSVSVRRGEVLGIAGLVGAGRTEFIRLLAGVERPDAGSILMDGSPVAFRTRAAAARLGIGLVPEDRKKEGIVPLRTILANVSLPILGRLARLGVLPQAQMRAKASEFLKRVALRPMQVDREIRNFSGGNQQKAIIARWLMADCKVFLLDEPTRGIDVGAKQEIYDLIDALADAGKAVVVVSSELPEIIRLSDRVMVICEGANAAVLDAVDLSESQILAFAVPSGAGGRAGQNGGAHDRRRPA